MPGAPVAECLGVGREGRWITSGGLGIKADFTILALKGVGFIFIIRVLYIKLFTTTQGTLRFGHITLLGLAHHTAIGAAVHLKIQSTRCPDVQ